MARYSRTPGPVTFKVNFMIAGTQKGGTTALAHFLAKHPEIHVAPVKETHFFDREAYFVNGQPDYNIFHSFFMPADNCKVIGEATPCYMVFPQIGPRLKKYNPELKLIVLLRHPVERAYSHYNMSARMKMEYLPFYNALRVEDVRLRDIKENNIFMGPGTFYSYKLRSSYLSQVKNLLELFPRNQLLFLRSEDLINDHQGTLAKVFDFLEVENDLSIKPGKINEGSYPPMADSVRLELLKLFSPETDELETLLGWDLQDWRK